MNLDINSLLQKIPFLQPKEEDAEQLGLVGIRFRQDKILIAYTMGDTKEDLNLIFINEKNASTWEERTQALTALVEEYNLQGQKANVAITPRDYRLAMIEKPDSEIDSLEEEVAYLISDYLDYKVEEAAIDYFSLPFARSSDNKQVLFAASMKLSLMDEIEACVTTAGLKLDAIDIPEFCYRNLNCLEQSSVKGYMIVNLGELGATLYTYNNKDVIMSRRIEFDLSKFANGKNVTIADGSEDEVLDSFTLQLQRSIDYCNSIFRQAPIEKLIIFSSEIEADIISKYISRQLGVASSVYDINKVIEIPDEFKDKDYKQFYPAIGASLRYFNFDSVDKEKEQNATN